MSDNKTRYREIQTSLEKLYPTQPKGNFARNLNTMAAMISGIVGSKNTQLPKIASKVSQEAKSTSVEKRVKCWIINEKLDGDHYSLPFAEALLSKLGLQEIVLAMDGSIVGRGCITLMVNLIYKKRALPFAYIVVKGKRNISRKTAISHWQRRFIICFPIPPQRLFSWVMASLMEPNCKAL